MKIAKCYGCEQEKLCGDMWLYPPGSETRHLKYVCEDCWEKLISTLGTGKTKADGYAGGGYRVIRDSKSLS